MSLPGILIFAVVYAFISARRLSTLRLDRPAVVLLGAVACVATGALSPDGALAAIDLHTLQLLLGMVGIGAFLELEGTLGRLEHRIVAWSDSPKALMGFILWGAGLLSALITNDAVCLLAAPMVVRIIRRHGLPPLPFLLALATGANTGSVATLVGNPQNMLCAALGGLSYAEHLRLVGPIAIAALGLNHALLALLFRRALADAPRLASSPPPPPARGPRWTVPVIVACALAFALGAPLPWTATAGFASLLILNGVDSRQIWPKIDFSLLLFFAGLFVVVEAFNASGAPRWLFDRLPLDMEAGGGFAWGRVAALFLVGSNVVSNVPFILIARPEVAALSNPKLGWELLAVASTFAGNLTLMGSVANIIVAEAARDLGGLGFRDHLRVGLPLALLSTALGTLWLVWLLG